MNNQQKIKNKFLIVLGALFLSVIVLLIYVGFFNNQQDTYADVSVVGVFSGVDQGVLSGIKSSQYLNSISSITLDWNLGESDFSNLVINGNIPIETRLEGRENPFIPY